MTKSVLLLLLLSPLLSLQQSSCPQSPTPGEDPVIISACASLRSRVSEAVRTGGTDVVFTADLTFYPTQTINGTPVLPSFATRIVSSAATGVLIGNIGTTGIGYAASDAAGAGPTNAPSGSGALGGNTAGTQMTSPITSQSSQAASSAAASSGTPASSAAAMSGGSGGSTPQKSYTERVILPATLATIIPVVVIAVLLTLFFLKRRQKKRDAEKDGLIGAGAAAGTTGIGGSPYSSAQYQDTQYQEKLPEIPQGGFDTGESSYPSQQVPSSNTGATDWGQIGTAHTTDEVHTGPATGVAAGLGAGAAATAISGHNRKDEGSSARNRNLAAPTTSSTSHQQQQQQQQGTWIDYRNSYSESDRSGRQEGDQSSTVDTEGDRFVTPMEKFTPPFGTPTMDALQTQQSPFGTDAASATAGIGGGVAAASSSRGQTSPRRTPKEFSLGVGAYPSTSESEEGGEGEGATTPTQESTNRGSSWFSGNALSWFGSSQGSSSGPPPPGTATTRNDTDEADLADSEQPAKRDSKRSATRESNTKSPRPAEGHTSWLAAPSPPASAAHGRTRSDGSSMEPIPSSGTEPSADGAPPIPENPALNGQHGNDTAESNMPGSRASTQAQQVYRQFRSRGGSGNGGHSNGRKQTAMSMSATHESIEYGGAETPQTMHRVNTPDA